MEVWPWDLLPTSKVIEAVLYIYLNNDLHPGMDWKVWNGQTFDVGEDQVSNASMTY